MLLSGKKRPSLSGTPISSRRGGLRPPGVSALGVNDGWQVLAVAWGLGERRDVPPDISPLIGSTQRNASLELSIWTNPSVHQVAPRGSHPLTALNHLGDAQRHGQDAAARPLQHTDAARLLPDLDLKRGVTEPFPGQTTEGLTRWPAASDLHCFLRLHSCEKFIPEGKKTACVYLLVPAIIAHLSQTCH